MALTLQYHETLNPKLWDESDRLRPEVRSKLLEIAHEWLRFAKIPEEKVHEIVFTGSSANYNYTDKSDLDIHIAVDTEGDPDAGEWFYDKFRVWKSKYPGIRVRGYPVEIYAHDVDEPFPTTQGVYSLVDDVWLNHPTKTPVDYDSDANLKKRVNYYSKMIRQLLRQDGSSQAIRELKDQFFAGRTAGLTKVGENSIENLTYKELRNRGLIDKLNAYSDTEMEKKLSLESVQRARTRVLNLKRVRNLPANGEEYQPEGGADYPLGQPSPPGMKD